MFYHSYSINFDFLSVIVHVTVGVHNSVCPSIRQLKHSFNSEATKDK